MAFAAGLTGALAASPVCAAEAKPEKAQGPTSVELPPFFAPMTVDGQLVSYAYLTIALTPASASKVVDIRAKMAFLLDAFLREANRGSIVKADDPKSVDTDALKIRLLERMKTILPPGTVTDLKFPEVAVTPVHPDER